MDTETRCLHFKAVLPLATSINQNKTKSKLQILKNCQKFKFCKTLYTRHTFWSCLIRCINVKMDPTRSVGAIDRMRDRRTDGRTETNIAPTTTSLCEGYNYIMTMMISCLSVWYNPGTSNILTPLYELWRYMHQGISVRLLYATVLHFALSWCMPQLNWSNNITISISLFATSTFSSVRKNQDYLCVVIEVPQIQATHAVYGGEQCWVDGWPASVIHIVIVVLKRVQGTILLEIQHRWKH